MSLLVVGSVAFDSVETPFGKADEALGGSATFFSIAASFFTKVKLVAVVGEDFHRKHITMLRKKKIDTEGITVERGKTFRWKGRYDFDLNNRTTIYTHLNVFEKFNPVIPENYKNSKYVFLANIDPELQLSVLRQVKKPKLVACDSMNLWIEMKRKSLIKLLKYVDIFFLNDSEAREFAQTANLIKAARWIRSLGPKKIVIKKGEHGVLFFNRDSIFSAPAYLLETINDPTGAGDTFAGGFMGYITSLPKVTNADLKKALVYGTIIASYSVEDFSVNRLLKLKKTDITKRYRKFKRLTAF